MKRGFSSQGRNSGRRRQRFAAPKFNWKKINTRLLAVLCIFLVCSILLTLKVTSIKVLHGEEYELAAKTQQVNRYDTVLPANRGMIVDRNFQAFAVSTTVYNIVLDPLVLKEVQDLYDKSTKANKVDEVERTIKTLSEALNLDALELKRYVSINPETGELYKNNHWTVLAKKVPRETAEALMEQNLKGVVYEKDSERRYPLNALAANVLGFVRGDTKWGLESTYDSYMSGTPGRSFITYDGDGNVITQEIKPIDGKTVVTTIDYTMQQFAQQIATDAMIEQGAQNSAVTIMNPKTGEILAMAQGSQFNPNDPSTPYPILQGNEEFKQLWEAYSDEERMNYLNSVWNNFCVASTYEPGSVFKPITVAMALEEGVISLEDTYYCSGVKTVYDYDIRCWKRDGHGRLDVEGAIANSCNIALMDMVEKIGKKTFYKYQKDFGFGSKTGIDLPAEVAAASLMYKEADIGPVELATMSFGQSFNCTTVQIMMAYAALINGGELLKPYVVSQVLDADGNVVFQNQKEVVRRVISTETSEILKKYMVATMEAGTGTKARIEGYRIGGKTGTGQQGIRTKGVHTVDFFTYLPADDPEYLCFVVLDNIENYQDGVTTPAYAMKGILENLIKYKGIFPDDAAAGLNIASSNAEKVTLDNYAGSNMNDVSQALAKKGIAYEVVGVGNKVTEQVPVEGTSVDKGSTILLYVDKETDADGNIVVPYLIGGSYDNAVGSLMDIGLSPVLTGDETGTVVAQSPLYGVSLSSGDDVTIRLEAAKDTPAE